MRWIYISPHLDDAALSAGGWIYEQTRSGAEVEIWTIMCGFPSGEVSPFAQLLHAQWGISDSSELIHARRLEDENAARILGAKTAHFDFLDCIYRRGKNGEWLYIDIFTPPHEDEAELPAQIAAAIAAQLKPDDRVVCQFAIGPHVDHVLVRRAVELLNRPLTYFADLPYLFKDSEQLAGHIANLRVSTVKVSAAGLKVWQDAVAEYASQISGLFDDLEDMRSKISNYAAENGGIRFWS